MTYSQFEDLPVWKEAAQLYEGVEELLETDGCPVSRGFRDQLDRAALSVSNNIAEGFERGTTNELLMFIYIARGSAGEVRSMLALLARRAHRKGLTGLKASVAVLNAKAISCSKQLRGWADSLQNSDIKGQRHLNEKSRREEDARKRAIACQQKLLRTLPPGHVLRKQAEERGLI
jgi:four helix bundle protein